MSIANAAATPLLIVGACPKETLPPAEPFVYCSAAYGTPYDSAAAIRFIEATATAEEVRLGLVGVDIPVSRAYMDAGAEYGSAARMQVATRQIMPLTVTDFTPFATQVAQSGANWAWAGGPWGDEIGPFDALQKLGWRGSYLLWAHQPPKKSSAVDVRRTCTGWPRIRSLPRTCRSTPRSEPRRPAMARPTGRATSRGLGYGHGARGDVRSVEAPGLAAQVQVALNKLDLDTRGLRGTRLTFTPENHFRTRISYRVYHWDNVQQRIVALRDSETVDVQPRAR